MVYTGILMAKGLSFANLIGAFPSGIAQGIIWGIMALGVYITFRLLGVSDLTVDGSFTTGGAVVAMMLLNGHNVWIAMAVSMLAGMAAGIVTGLLNTKMGIPAILSGILTQFALYSVNLAIMGMVANKAIPVDKYHLAITSRNIPMAIVTGLLFTAVIIGILYWYFGTEHGSAMRATGCNSAMAKAQGININVMTVLGLAIANGLVALAGGMMAQYQGFADINMGRGAIVIGLAAVIIGEVIGEALLAKYLNFAGRLSFVVIGGILYYIIVIIVLWLKINSNMLKLFTSIIVAIFLAVPYLQEHQKTSFARAGKNAAKASKEA